LTDVVGRWLRDPAAADLVARHGRQVILENRGATRRSVAAIAEVLGYQMPPGERGIATPRLGLKSTLRSPGRPRKEKPNAPRPQK
jgi:hypothetical protein